MVVEVPVSSMKTSRAGSRAGCSACHAARAAATSGRSCSLACTIFFEADALGGKEPPHRSVADMLAAGGELGADLLECQVGSRGDPLKQPSPLRFQSGAAIATHRLGHKPPFIAPGIHPLDYR